MPTIRNIITITFALCLCSCTEDTKFSEIPHIEFRGIGNDHLAQSTLSDTAFFYLFLEDAEGDIGSNNNGVKDLFFRDLRDSSILSYSMPKVNQEGAGNGISAEITALFITKRKDYCCIFPDNTPPCTASDTYPVDTINFDVWLKDQAGHQSNIIQAGPLYLRCDE